MAETPQSPESAADQPLADAPARTPEPEALAVESLPAQESQLESQPPAAGTEPLAVDGPDGAAAGGAEAAQPPLETAIAVEPAVAAPVSGDAAAFTASAITAEPIAPAVSSADASPEPAPEPAPEPEPAPATPSAQPALEGVAATITVPALDAAAVGEGGEWELLVGKVRAWLDGADLQRRWDALGGPLRGLGLLLAAVVVLRVYGALLETLGDLPLLPRLLQLVGLISVSRFALRRLVRSSERQRLLSSWGQRWNEFRGRA